MARFVIPVEFEFEAESAEEASLAFKEASNFCDGVFSVFVNTETVYEFPAKEKEES